MNIPNTLPKPRGKETSGTLNVIAAAVTLVLVAATVACGSPATPPTDPTPEEQTSQNKQTKGSENTPTTSVSVATEAHTAITFAAPNPVSEESMIQNYDGVELFTRKYDAPVVTAGTDPSRGCVQLVEFLGVGDKAGKLVGAQWSKSGKPRLSCRFDGAVDRASQHPSDRGAVTLKWDIVSAA